MAEIYQLPENGNNAGTNIPFSIPIGLGGYGNGGFGFGNGGFNSIADLFALGILSSMFGGGWGNSNTGVDYLKKTLEEDEKKKEEQVYVIPEK